MKGTLLPALTLNAGIGHTSCAAESSSINKISRDTGLVCVCVHESVCSYMCTHTHVLYVCPVTKGMLGGPVKFKPKGRV